MENKNLIYDAIHKVTKVLSVNYQFIKSPVVDSVENNFSFLRMDDHCSNSNKETFFINANTTLRTHCSNFQTIACKIHNLSQIKEAKYFTVGRVFRKDDSSRHSYFFHQCDGLIFGENIKIENIFQEIKTIYQLIIQRPFKMRMRESYFPFTYASYEIDIMLNNNWIEVMGCGFMHEDIVKNNNIKTECFAFGFGIERLGFIVNSIDNIKKMRKT